MLIILNALCLKILVMSISFVELARSQKLVNGKIKDLVLRNAFTANTYHTFGCMDIDPDTNDRIYGGMMREGAMLANTYTS